MWIGEPLDVGSGLVCVIGVRGCAMDGEQLAAEELERELAELGHDDDENDHHDESNDAGAAGNDGGSGGGGGAVKVLGKRDREQQQGRIAGSEAAVEEDAEEEEEEDEESDADELDETAGLEEGKAGGRAMSTGKRPRQQQKPKPVTAIAGLEPSVAEIWARPKPQRKRQRPRTGKTAGRVLPDEIASVLGQATNAYIMGDHTTVRLGE